MENAIKEQARQLLKLECRRNLELDGVLDVKSFDDTLICLESNMGRMNIEGKELRITKFLVQTTEIAICGIIDAIIFFEAEKERKSFFSKFTR